MWAYASAGGNGRSAGGGNAAWAGNCSGRRGHRTMRIGCQTYTWEMLGAAWTDAPEDTHN